MPREGLVRRGHDEAAVPLLTFGGDSDDDFDGGANYELDAPARHNSRPKAAKREPRAVRQTTPGQVLVEVKVRPSDTLAALALRFNVAKAELKRLNSILTDNELHARATIRVPVRLGSVLTETLPEIHEKAKAAEAAADGGWTIVEDTGSGGRTDDSAHEDDRSATPNGPHRAGTCAKSEARKLLNNVDRKVAEAKLRTDLLMLNGLGADTPLRSAHLESSSASDHMQKGLCCCLCLVLTVVTAVALILAFAKHEFFLIQTEATNLTAWHEHHQKHH